MTNAMRSIFYFLWMWILPLWGLISSLYFQAAYVYVWRRTGISLWKVWWRTSGNKTERRFAEEIARFPGWKIAYEIVKWGTLVVVLGYLASTAAYMLHLR